jgi:anti-anti-sigma regulatory factor
MLEPSTPTSSEHAGRDTRRADQDRTLAAMHALEAALGSAAPGRESSWRAEVLAALVVLDDATDDEYANAIKPDSLLSDIKRTQPRLRTRVRGLRTQYAHLRQMVKNVRAELAGPADDVTNFADLRQRLALLLTALRHQRARESDLIHEAYYDAFDTELSHDGEPTQNRPLVQGTVREGRPRMGRPAMPDEAVTASPVPSDESAPFRAVPIDATTVAIRGVVDTCTAPDLAAALADPIVDRVILTAVTFIDAAGLAVLLQAHRSRPQGLTLLSPNRSVVRLLDLACHGSTFRIGNF